MAIYHFSGTIISRNKGQSSVAASAYRAAEKIVDVRTGITHNFIQHQCDLIHKVILLPKHAPTWMAQRTKLWNEVERVEKRKDAQLAREFVFALPLELTPDQNIALATAFVQAAFVSLGMVADLYIHSGHAGINQPHSHVMLTMRLLTSAGFGLKEFAWSRKQMLFTWRKAWTEHCNVALQRYGHDARIDHRSFKAQGITLEPQGKIGPPGSRFYQERLLEHQAIVMRNGERLLKDPTMVLKMLKQGRSSFSEQELIQFVRRHSVTDEQFGAVLQAVKQSEIAISKEMNEDK